MAYVQPNSIIQFFKGINLDNRYLHTIYFANESAQNTWFTSKVTSGLTFSNMMYRRYTSQSVKVEADATTFLGVTYMRFKNTRTANKWFYAFVLSADYVNENTTLVTYEIDVMQTWFIQNGSVRPCMVLREHVNDDSYHENLEEEPIGSEVYNYEFIKDANTITTDDDAFTDYSVVVNTTGKPTGSERTYRNGVFTGTRFKTIQCNSETDAEDNVIPMLQAMIGDWDEGQQLEDVLDMYTVPTFLAVGDILEEYELDIPSLPTYSGYTPKNKKLFSYPFTYLYCTTHNGNANMYRWEYFPHSFPPNNYIHEFYIKGSGLGGGQVMCYPHNYDGIDRNYDAKVVISDFPKNSFSYDAYQAWLASGGKTKLENEEKLVKARGITNIVATGSNLISTGSQSVSNISNIIKGTDRLGRTLNRSTADKISSTIGEINNTIQAGANLSNAITNYIEAQNKIDYQWKDASYRPNEVVGSSEPALMVGARLLNFYFYNVHVADSEMKRLDDFLSCYGYAINRVKAPNLTGRQYWNFVQTQNAVIAGDMPSSSKEAIGRIFDGGITFWHNGDQVGNYRQSVSNDSINNPIV